MYKSKKNKSVLLLIKAKKHKYFFLYIYNEYLLFSSVAYFYKFLK